jgi:putative two-component system protein, hydrogenase maturation factor HypX/HoxX
MNPSRSDERASSLRILFLVSAHNGLSQRAWIALTELGHEVEVAVVDSAAAMEAAVREHDPDLIVCPFLKKMIPESIWSECRCLVVHPGPPGDRGPSSLDWAIELGMREWGVTVLEANGQFDAGEVWATRSFRMRGAGKSTLYRHEVRRAAVEALVDAIGKIAAGADRPEVPASEEATARPLMGQDVRAIDWASDTTGIVVRKVRAGEGHPGVLDVIRGTEFHLFGAHPERVLSGRPGEIIAQRNGAICRATVDGGVWITQLKPADTATERFYKLPATRALGLAGHAVDAPEIAVALDARWRSDQTYREIAYRQHGAVGYLHFDFYNGAMSSEQCRRLRDAYAYARSGPRTKVIVLMGGHDYFSNGIHLNVIEAAEDAAEESWRNLNAIDDLVRDIIETDSHLVISALGGDAAAGGVTLALAADEVYGREDIVLNPYYQHMGGLFGSEYWTYLMPRRIGVEMTARITGAPFNPLGARRAMQIGLLDAVFGASIQDFHRQTREHAEQLATDAAFELRLEQKRRRRARDEQIKPLQAYRDEEMARSHECFFGPDRSYHQARQRFAYKLTAPKLTVVRTEAALAGATGASERAA